MRWLITAILALTTAAVLPALAEEGEAKDNQIGSALGMTLGAKFQPPGRGKPKKGDPPPAEAKTFSDRDGTVFRYYTPPKTQEPFTEYLACVTPRTGVVAQIMARAKFDGEDQANAARTKLLKALEGRYGAASAGGEPLAEAAKMLGGSAIIQGSRYIMLTVEPEGRQFLLCLRYADKVLTSRFRNEYQENERNRDVNPGDKLPDSPL